MLFYVLSFMFDALGVFYSVLRMFLRVVFRVRVFLVSIVKSLTVSPGRRSWGGSGGPGGPALGGVRGGTLPGVSGFISSLSGFSYSLFPLPLGGVGVGKHKSLLDLLVLYDTKGVIVGCKGSPTLPVRCEVCGRPINACRCVAGRDY